MHTTCRLAVCKSMCGRHLPVGCCAPAKQHPLAHPLLLDIGRRGEDGEPFSAACAALTDDCIVLGLPDGTLAFYHAGDWSLASQYAHAGGGIEKVFPSMDGTM